MRVLVVEDEKRLATGLKNGLEAEGFATDVILNGTDGLWMARENSYDAIVLDIMLPGMNGFKVCSALREEGNWTPILMLTAKDGPTITSRSPSPMSSWWRVCEPFSGGALRRGPPSWRQVTCVSTRARRKCRGLGMSCS